VTGSSATNDHVLTTDGLTKDFRGFVAVKSVCLKVRRNSIHALIGIPIGVALALSVGGAYFMAVYLRAYKRTSSAIAATLESTRAHTAYNALIITLVAFAIAYDAVH